MDISLRVALSELKKEVDEKETEFGKVIHQYHVEIERIARERELPFRDVLNVLGVDLQPRLKRKRGPTGYNLFTAAETRGKACQDGTLLAKAAKLWKDLSQEEKNTFNPDNCEHESPRKKRRYKEKHQQMVDVIKELHILAGEYELLGGHIIVMAVDPKTNERPQLGESECYLTSPDGVAWQQSTEESGGGLVTGYQMFKDFVKTTYTTKRLHQCSAFQERLESILRPGTSRDAQTTENPSTDSSARDRRALSKDTLESQISTALREVFGQSIKKTLTSMPNKGQWKEWLSKHQKQVVIEIEGITEEDLKNRREKAPSMTLEKRHKILQGLQEGLIYLEEQTS